MCFKHLPEDIETVGFFFLRNSIDPVPVPSTIEDAAQTLPLLFETGTITNKSLQLLENVLKHLYTPLLMETGQKSAEMLETEATDQEHERPVSRTGTRAVHLRDEVLINVQKFTSQVRQAIQQIEGEVKLDIPSVDQSVDPQIAAKDGVFVSQLEACVDSWARVISNTVDEQLKKSPQGNGPLAEVDFWKERNSALNALYLQLQTDVVFYILAVLRAAVSASHSAFEVSRVEMNKYFVEAKDNVKFLGTLERHFKNITHGASFQVVIDTLPTMMNSLRMVWVISRHYNTDERMVPLMERIAWELCERVARIINIRTIFKYVSIVIPVVVQCLLFT